MLDEPATGTPVEVKWQTRLLSEQDNLRAAAEWARVHDPRAHLMLGCSLYAYWIMRGHWKDARIWLEDVDREKGNIPVEDRIRILNVAAKVVLEVNGDRARSEGLIAESLELRSGLGDKAARADALALTAEQNLERGDVEAANRQYSESLRLHEEVGNTAGIYAALNGLVLASTYTGNYPQAQLWCEQALRLARTLDNKHELAAWLNLVGQILMWQGSADAKHVVEEIDLDVVTAP